MRGPFCFVLDVSVVDSFGLERLEFGFPKQNSEQVGVDVFLVMMYNEGDMRGIW